MRAKKRLFIGLVGLTLVPVVAGMWLVASLTLWQRYGRIVAFLVFAFLAAVVVFAAIGLLAMVYMIETGKAIRVRLPLRLVVDIFYPLALRVGRFLGMSREKIQCSFVEVNNSLTKTIPVQINPKDVLVLIPHCIQYSECTYKITVDVENCRGCGRCQIRQLRQLVAQYGVGLAVATGGGMARRIIQERQPKAVVAVACERDLTSGLQETFPLPVYGIVNLRPQGYCFNTAVDLNKIGSALDLFIHGVRGPITQQKEIAASSQ